MLSNSLESHLIGLMPSKHYILDMVLPLLWQGEDFSSVSCKFYQTVFDIIISRTV